MADTTTSSPAATVDGLVGKATGWIDQIFGFAGLYTSKYSKYIVYALILFLLSKMLKIKVNVGGAGGGK